MIHFIQKLFHLDFYILGSLRSPRWSDVRARHLRSNPACVVCGKTNKWVITVHHKKPFHLFPELELDPKNLVTLCESAGMNCHITFGHLGTFKSYNENIDADVIYWGQKVKNRPI